MASFSTPRSYQTRHDLSYGDAGGHGDGEFSDAVQEVKHDLEGWRELLLPIASLLRWDLSYFPAVIFAVTTFLYSIVWVLDLSTLTTISLACMLIGIADFVIPFIGPSITGYKTWTGEEELQFSAICEKIYGIKQDVVDCWRGLALMRQSNAKLFFVGTMGLLAVTAWVGNLVNNLFLSYLIVTFLLLVPGLRQRQIGQRYLQPVLRILQQLKAKTSKLKES